MPRIPILVLGCLLLASPDPVEAQDPDIQRQIMESQRRLEAIREERARLQAEMEQVRSRVRNASTELRNIEQQLSASRSVLSELERSAEATIIFSTFSAKCPRTTPEAAREAMFSF